MPGATLGWAARTFAVRAISTTGCRSFNVSYGSPFTSVWLTVKLLATPENVCPSVDFAAASTPITVPAPGRFSMSTCRPSDFGMSWVSRRTTVSMVLPPGGNGTMIRTGRAGHAGEGCCAQTAPEMTLVAHASKAIAKKTRHLLFSCIACSCLTAISSGELDDSGAETRSRLCYEIAGRISF